MSITNISNFRKNLFDFTEQVIKYNDPVTVTAKTGNVVLLSEEEYNSLIETLYISAVPGLEKELVRLKNTDSSSEEFVSENEVNWDAISD